MSIKQGNRIIAGASQYHPGLFDVKWSDHICNDVQWLRADTFSWQSGAVYEVAYDHLVDDIDGKTLQSEIIVGITVQFYLANDGHKVCPASEESNIAAIYAATGIAWYYIIDTTNQRFKLPRTKFGFTGIRNSVGGFVEAGLPNGTGKLTGLKSVSGSYTDGIVKWERGGAEGVYGSGGGAYGTFTIDLQQGNPIYGNSDTVQSPATQMYLYFYIGNFTQSAIENTAGLNTELFNGKVDVGHQVIAFQAPTAGNNYTWYRLYADGWVEQGGIKVIIANNSNYLQSLPITMADTHYTVTIAQCATNDSDYQAFYYNQGCILARTTTTVTLSNRRFNGSGTYTLDIMWQVSGMAAN